MTSFDYRGGLPRAGGGSAGREGGGSAGREGGGEDAAGGGDIRGELDGFWNEVARYNREHPIVDEEACRVTFYFGQMVTRPGDNDEAGGVLAGENK